MVGNPLKPFAGLEFLLNLDGEIFPMDNGKTTWDHAHRMNKVEPYEFGSAEQLLEDFWCEVDKILNEGKR